MLSGYEPDAPYTSYERVKDRVIGTKELTRIKNPAMSTHRFDPEVGWRLGRWK